MSLCAKRVDFSAVWPQLEQDIQHLFEHQHLEQLSAMRLYNDVYDLCVARPVNHWEALLVALTKLLADHCDQVCKNLLSSTDIVSAYSAEWTRYQQSSAWLDQVCRYLNMELATTRPTKRTLQAMNTWLNLLTLTRKLKVEALAYELWKQRILLTMQDRHQDRLKEAVMEHIRRDRNGEIPTNAAVRTTVASFVQLGRFSHDQPLQLFLDHFETPYIRETASFYQQESARWISNLSVADYMEKVVKCLREEEQRCRQFCDSSSTERIMHHCTDVLVTCYRDRFHAEFDHLMVKESVKSMGHVYQLLSRIRDGMSVLVKKLEQHIITDTKTLIRGQMDAIRKEPTLYVERTMKIYSKYTAWVVDAFHADVAFQAAVDKAFRSIMNDSLVHLNVSEILAKYCDGLLKKGASGGGKASGAASSSSAGTAITEQETEQNLGRAILLFTYVDDKDVFQKFYARLLAKRLIYGTSTSNDLEESAITQLKNACGLEYTAKFVRMMTDMNVSEDLNAGFRTTFQQHNKPRLPMDMSALVLAAGAWPLEQKPNHEFLVPQELERPITEFSTFYHAKHSGRRLFWLHHLARAEVRLHGWDKRYEVTLSGYQLAMVLMFNDKTRLSLGEMREGTKLAVDDLARLIKPLVQMQLLMVVEEEKNLIPVEPSPDGGRNPAIANKSPWSEHTVFCLNETFTSKRTKLKLNNAPLQADSPAQESTTRESIEEDRKLYLQATIVRIMKARKRLKRQELVEEVIRHAKERFHPSIPMLHDCIKQLVAKEYMEQQEQDDTLVYV